MPNGSQFRNKPRTHRARPILDPRGPAPARVFNRKHDLTVELDAKKHCPVTAPLRSRVTPEWWRVMPPAINLDVGTYLARVDSCLGPPEKTVENCAPLHHRRISQSTLVFGYVDVRPEGRT